MVSPSKIIGINYNKINGLSRDEQVQLAALDQAPWDGMLSGAELSRALLDRVHNAPLSALFRAGLNKTSSQRQSVIAVFREFQPLLQAHMLLQVSSLRQRELLMALIDPTSPDPMRDVGYVLHQLPAIDDGMLGALIFAGLREINPGLVMAAQEAALSGSYGDERGSARARLKAYWQKSQRLPEIRPLDYQFASTGVAMGYFPNREAAIRYMQRHPVSMMSLPGEWTERYALYMAGQATGVVLLIYAGQAHMVMPKSGYQPTMLAQYDFDLDITPLELPPAIPITTQQRITMLYIEGKILATEGSPGKWQAALEKFKEIIKLDPNQLSAYCFAADEEANLGHRAEAIAHWEKAVEGWSNLLRYQPDYFKSHPEEAREFEIAKAKIVGAE